MTFSALYVLPALAILILIQGSWISHRAKDMYRSRKQQRRARHRILFFRALVVALILATALTKAWPLPPLLEIVQGVMITIAIMIPICVYIVINMLWPQSASDKRQHEVNPGEPMDSPDLRPAPAPAHLFAEATSSSQGQEEPQQPVAPTVQQPEARAEQVRENSKESLEDSLDELLNEPHRESFSEPLKEQSQTSFNEPPAEQLRESFRDTQNDAPLKSSQEPLRESFNDLPGKLRSEAVDIALDAGPTDSLQTPQTDSEQPASSPAGRMSAATSLHSHSSEQESALDQTLSVGEQLETLDDLVDFHDIGDDDYESQATGPYDPEAPLLYNPLEKAIAVARDAILDEPGIQDYSTENLPAKSRIELSEMVVRLRNDKMKLQKLVIAQKAVIDSEKQAHERTRVVVKDAISVMRHARHGQRIAEKIARRERAERQRLEKDYIKVRRALDNALSTLKSKSERSEAEKA